MAQRDDLSASAFLIGDQLALTTAGLVGNQTQVFLTFPDQPTALAKVVFSDRENDVALLRSEGLDPSSFPCPWTTPGSLATKGGTLPDRLSGGAVH